MKSFLKYALVIFLVFAFTNANAQIKSRYAFGLNLSTMTMKIEGLTSGPDTPFGIHFGKIFELPVTGIFTFQTGLLFSAKGTDYQIDSTDFSLSPIYIEIPVNAVLSFGTDAVKVSLFAGPYFAFGVGGTMLESGRGLKDLRFGTGENKDLKPFDIGLNFGVGICIKKFMVTAQYGIGLTNVSPHTADNSEMKNKVIGISINSSFTGNK